MFLVNWTALNAVIAIAALVTMTYLTWSTWPGVRTSWRLVLRLAFEVWSRRFDSGSFIELTVITSPRMDDALQLEGPASLEITLPCTGAGLWIRGFYMPNGPYYGFQSPEIG